MSITPEQLIAAFQVTGSNPDDISYTRVLTTELAPVPLIVSNSGTFVIRFFPTASAGISFKTEDDVTVDSISPIDLAPTSGSKILAIIDTSTFDGERLSTKSYDIGFNMVAITASFGGIFRSNATGSNTASLRPITVTDRATPTDTTGQPCTPAGQIPVLYSCCPGLNPVRVPPSQLEVCA